MIKMSENHARINGITNVQFLHGKVEDSDLVYSGGVVQFKRDDLPCEPFKCDILISEWMGYALLYENMLSSVLFARDRYLISGGLMVPSKVKLGLFAVDMYDDIESKLNEWDERKYGLILDGLRYEAHELLKEPVVEVVDPSRIVSDASGICILDLGRLNKQDLGKAHEFQVDVHDGCKCSSLALYFDCIFEPVASADAIHSLKGKCFQTLESYREVLGIDELTSYVTSPDYIHPEEPKSTVVVMSTRADQPPTHWKQVILHLTDHNNRPVAIQGTIGGKLSLLNNPSNCRWLDILFQPDDTSLLGECYYKLM
uniref:Protein arginine N-methyltransferase domain-containing protein n=1 Tax=Babesia bovis TaxID=5865 RepID=S6B297_BABBO|nr:conserved hypothetical protein [Babesia bovis]